MVVVLVQPFTDCPLTLQFGTVVVGTDGSLPYPLTVAEGEGMGIALVGGTGVLVVCPLNVAEITTPLVSVCVVTGFGILSSCEQLRLL